MNGMHSCYTFRDLNYEKILSYLYRALFPATEFLIVMASCIGTLAFDI